MYVRVYVCTRGKKVYLIVYLIMISHYVISFIIDKNSREFIEIYCFVVLAMSKLTNSILKLSTTLGQIMYTNVSILNFISESLFDIES